MNVEQLRESGWIIRECIVGSHLYRTNKEGSDVDVKGVYIQPTEQILGGRYIPQISDDKNDCTYYEVGRFIELLENGNPNTLDILGSDLVNISSPIYEEFFSDVTPFLTTKLKHTFLGYSYSQIQKAKGMNKKTNWEKSKTVRRDVLDFCYVLMDGEKSLKIKSWLSKNKKLQTDFVLAKVNNFPDMYTMYRAVNGNGGIVGENSNDVRVREVSKYRIPVTYMRFDKNAYSTHCKDYREYQEWLKKRNPLRYEDNAKADNKFDCYLDSSTEYLTEFGWKKYDDIQNDEMLITIDNEGNKILSPIIDRVKKEYSGDIYTYQNAYTRFSVTPNHNLFLSKSPRKPSQKFKVILNTDDLKFITVEDFFKNTKASTYTLFNSCKNNDNELSVDDCYLKLMGLFLSDGSLEFNNNKPSCVRIYQSEGGKITKTIGSISYKFKEYSYKRDGKKKEYIYVFDKNLAERLYKDCGHGSRNKSLPFWANELSTRQLKLLVEYMFYGDGYNHSKGHKVYYTVSKKLANSLQSACLCAGITTKIMGPYKQETSFGVIDEMYQVYFPIKEFYLNFLNKKKSTLKSYSGWSVQKVSDEYISCFTTSSGIVITRNLNKVAIQGNTKNMSHCVRLLNTAKDLAEGKGLILNRPEKQFLIDIRNGLVPYEEIINLATRLEQEVSKAFDNSGLPRSVDKDFIYDTLVSIRLRGLIPVG